MTEEIAGLELKAKVMTAEYAAGKIGSKEYSTRYDKLVERHDTLKLEKMAKANEKEDKQYRAWELADFIQSLTSVTILPEFDEKVWLALVDQAQVQENGDIVFLLKNGERIR